MKQHSSGMAGVYYVAAELSRRNYTALVTTRNARAVDILAMNNDTMRALGIQVKTNSPKSPHDFWLLNKGDMSTDDSKLQNLAYVLVNLNKNRQPSFFVVPGKEVKANMYLDKASTGSEWYCIDRKDVASYSDKWDTVESLTR